MNPVIETPDLRAIIDKEGYLKLEKMSSKVISQICPHGTGNKKCGIQCPLFYVLKNDNKSELHLCDKVIKLESKNIEIWN
jgi:hypothetical protein